MGNELIDIYDENENFIGTESRDIAHQEALWHKTVHCWLVREPNSILFQMRSKKLDNNPGKLYTTASGHLSAGESLEEAFKREVKEEIGVSASDLNPVLIDKGKFIADFKKTNGEYFRDRALYSIFISNVKSDLSEFNFQDEELEGIFELPAKETLQLVKSEEGSVNAKGVIRENGELKVIDNIKMDISDFVVLPNETAYGKYGLVLEKAIELLEENK